MSQMMWVPILCGVVVVVGLIALISFNVIVRGKESVEEDVDVEQPLQEEVYDEEPTEQQPTVLSQSEGEKESIADRDYRNALKRFQEGESGEVVESDSEEERISDNAYREALRAMKQHQKSD